MSNYTVTFTDLAKAAAEASSSLAAVEAKARSGIDAEMWIGEPGRPRWRPSRPRRAPGSTPSCGSASRFAK